MRKNPLETLLRFRQSTLDEAQKLLCAAYTVEQVISNQVNQAINALDIEMRTAANLVGSDDTVETFARWLPVGRKRVSDAHLAQRNAIAELDRLRAVLTLARSSVRSVEVLIKQRHQQERMIDLRKEQHILDDIAGKHRAQ